jgi:hypothetical protein
MLKKKAIAHSSRQGAADQGPPKKRGTKEEKKTGNKRPTGLIRLGSCFLGVSLCFLAIGKAAA